MIPHNLCQFDHASNGHLQPFPPTTGYAAVNGTGWHFRHDAQATTLAISSKMMCKKKCQIRLMQKYGKLTTAVKYIIMMNINPKRKLYGTTYCNFWAKFRYIYCCELVSYDSPEISGNFCWRRPPTKSLNHTESVYNIIYLYNIYLNIFISVYLNINIK